MMKIDEFCNQQNIIPNLIKVDIDGNEDKFLNGDSNLLQNKNLRSIIIELDDKHIRDKCISIIKKNGFDLLFHFARSADSWEDSQIWLQKKDKLLYSLSLKIEYIKDEIDLKNEDPHIINR